jgi:hypothetical protein
MDEGSFSGVMNEGSFSGGGRMEGDAMILMSLMGHSSNCISYVVRAGQELSSRAPACMHEVLGSTIPSKKAILHSQGDPRSQQM